MKKTTLFGLVAAIAVTGMWTQRLVADEPLPPGIADQDPISRQIVQLAPEGGVVGQVVGYGSQRSVGGMAVTLVSGEATFRGRTDADGSFVVDGVVPGTYGMTAQNESFFAAYTVHVVAEGVEVPASPQLTIPAAPVARALVRQTASRYLPTSAPAVDPREASRVITPVAREPEALQRPVALEADGTFVGQLFFPYGEGGMVVPAANVNVMLIQDDVTVARGVSDENGIFRLAGVAEGPYAFLAAGPFGFGAVGVDLVAPGGAVADAGDSPVRFASHTAAQAGPAFSLELVPAQQVGPMMEPGFVEEEVVMMDPFGPPGFPGGGMMGGGGMGGGGGGFGGHGGLGPLLGLAIAGGIIAAILADDDDDDIFIPPPATPPGP